MSTFILDILTTSLVSSATSVVVAQFLLRTWLKKRIESSIQHEYDKKMEEFKTVMKVESETILEAKKAKLKAKSEEDSIKLAHLTPLIFDSLKNANLLLSKFLESVVNYSDANKQESKEKKLVMASTNKKVISFLNENRMYFASDVSDLIDDIYNDIQELGYNEMVQEPQEKSQLSKGHLFLNENYKAIQSKMDDLKMKCQHLTR